jgi:hypothetical protein
MAHTTIYRIEDSDGIGPYTGRKNPIRWQLLDSHCGGENWPIPLSDGINGFMSGIHLCAFDSLEALAEWFGEFVYRLLEHDYRIVEIDVPNNAIIRGNRQVVYNATYEIDKRVWLKAA